MVFIVIRILYSRLATPGMSTNIRVVDTAIAARSNPSTAAFSLSEIARYSSSETEQMNEISTIERSNHRSTVTRRLYPTVNAPLLSDSHAIVNC